MSEFKQSTKRNIESAVAHQPGRRDTTPTPGVSGSILKRKMEPQVTCMDPPAKRTKTDTATKLRRLMMFTNFPVELEEDTTVAREIRRVGTGYPWKMLETLISQFHQERVKNNLVHMELHWDDQEDAFFEEIHQLTSMCLLDSMISSRP